MVKDDNVPAQIFDYMDYAHSKEVIRDFPKLISIYDKLLPILYQFAHYQGVWETIVAVEDAKLLMEIQLDYYQQVFNNKGLRNV